MTALITNLFLLMRISAAMINVSQIGQIDGPFFLVSLLNIFHYANARVFQVEAVRSLSGRGLRVPQFFWDCLSASGFDEDLSLLKFERRFRNRANPV